MLFMLNQFSKFLKNTLNEQVLIQIEYYWWSQAGSNRRPPACKAGALPAELWPRDLIFIRLATTFAVIPTK